MDNDDKAHQFARRKEALELGLISIKHGLNGYKNYGCRCTTCSQAMKDDQVEYRKRLKEQGIVPKRRRKDAPITGDEAWHGSLTGYSNHRCRCERCREKMAEYMREIRKRRADDLKIGLHGTLEHGTWNAYCNYGCRCDLCKKAQVIQRQSRKKPDG